MTLQNEFRLIKSYFCEMDPESKHPVHVTLGLSITSTTDPAIIYSISLDHPGFQTSELHFEGRSYECVRRALKKWQQCLNILNHPDYKQEPQIKPMKA